MDKQAQYKELHGQIKALTENETYLMARLSTTTCVLNEAFEDFFWIGFYMVDPLKPEELVVGPYQGTLGCLRIPFGKGVCGTSAQNRETIIVEDVHQFPGHIACDSRSNSEIVVPFYDQDSNLIAVLDVDSTRFGAFDEIDKQGLEAICKLLA